ncbi:unnamed protein product, partial [Heterosigma akashiwo]
TEYDSPKNAEYRFCSEVIEKKHINELQSKGFVVIDGVLDNQSLKEATNYCQNFIQRHSFGSYDEDVRQDRVVWVVDENRDKTGRKPGTAAIHNTGLLHAFRIVQGAAQEIQRHSNEEHTNFNVPLRAQLAQYQKGGGYLAHRDSCNESFFDLGLLNWLSLAQYRRRRYTAILYLNDTSAVDQRWNKKRDGGCLRVYVDADPADDDGASSKEIIDIEPVGGRLILFDSRSVLHQVMPSHRERLAITVWIEDAF